MDRAAILEISRSIHSIDPVKFKRFLDDYIYTASIMDHALRNRGETDSKTSNDLDRCLEGVIREASGMLSESGTLMNRLLNLRFKMNGQFKGVPNLDENTRSCFAGMKKHQMEILASISDEIGIITEIVKQSGKMRTIVRRHCGIMRNAACFVDVIQERISSRPTLSTLRESDGQTMALESSDWDPSAGGEFALPGDKYGSANAAVVESFLPYDRLIRDSNIEIIERRKKILTEIRELKKGWKLLSKIALKGYSRRMRRDIDAMFRKHDKRVNEFGNAVRKNRSSLPPA